MATAPATGSEKPFRFLDLPRELRLPIYEYAVGDKECRTADVILHDVPAGATRVFIVNARETGLLLANHQIHAEYKDDTKAFKPSLLIRRVVPAHVQDYGHVEFKRLPQHRKVEVRTSVRCSEPAHHTLGISTDCQAGMEVDAVWRFYGACRHKLYHDHRAVMKIVVPWYPDHRADIMPPANPGARWAPDHALTICWKTGLWSWPHFPHFGILPRLPGGSSIRFLHIFGHDMVGPAPEFKQDYFPDEMIEHPEEAYATFDEIERQFFWNEPITRNWNWDTQLGWYQPQPPKQLLPAKPVEAESKPEQVKQDEVEEMQQDINAEEDSQQDVDMEESSEPENVEQKLE